MARAIGKCLLGLCLVATATAFSDMACRQTAFSSSWSPKFSSASQIICVKGRAGTQHSWAMMAKKVQKTGRAPVAKGFGAAPKIKGKLEELKDPVIVNLCDWLKAGGSSINKVAIADFQGLRGVAARQVIEAGEAIVSVPMEMALNLGSDGVNPGYAAARLCQIEKSPERRAAGWFQPFLDVLPTFDQCDTTEFFSEKELEALEWPLVIDETKERLKMLRSTYDASQIKGIDRTAQEAFTWEEFLWAVYQVVSRVLSIYTERDGSTKFLIPMIDMFNHDPKSAHMLKCTQGQFKVIAGKRINEGEQINIVYGGGVLNNDRIIQDYGFVQADNEYDIKQLILPASKEPMQGLPFCGMGCDKQKLNEVLRNFSTTLEEDVELLQAGNFDSKFMRSVLAFRVEKKKAIQNALERLP